MSILICGYGSIGRRHFHNLQSLGYSDISFFRTGRSTLLSEELDTITVYYDLDLALLANPDIVVIANPTATHMEVALKAAAAGANLFIEKPLSDALDDVLKLQQIVAQKNLVVMTGFQFRFHPGLLKVKSLLDESTIGEVVCVTARWAEYLPEWHPWEDYRQSYSALPELGGGVILTLCHPFDYLRWLLGNVSAVSAMSGYIGLDIPSEDSANILLQFDSGALGHIHLDYIQRPPVHNLQITGTNGLIQWDFMSGQTNWYVADLKRHHTYSIPENYTRNDLFIDEMKDFLAAVQKRKEPSCTLEDGVHALQIALAAKKSSQQGHHIKLNQAKYVLKTV